MSDPISGNRISPLLTQAVTPVAGPPQGPTLTPSAPVADNAAVRNFNAQALDDIDALRRLGTASELRDLPSGAQVHMVEGRIGRIDYPPQPDGSRRSRSFTYDDQGRIRQVRDTAGELWTRGEGDRWTSDRQSTWHGQVELRPDGTYIETGRSGVRNTFANDGTQATSRTRHTPVGSEINSAVIHSSIEMHPSWNAPPLDVCFDSQGRLQLSRLTPEIFKRLSPSHRQQLMSILARHQVEVTVQSAEGRSSRGRANAATSLAGVMWASGDSQAFAQAFAAAPAQVLPHLSGGGARVLTAENMALILREMAASGGKLEPHELDALGSLVQKYLEHHAGKDPARARAAVEQLMRAVADSGMEATPANAGVVTGALISGMIKHFDAIKASDEERNNMVNGVADGAAAIAGSIPPWGPAVAVGMIALRTAFNSGFKPRDFNEVASRMQGAIQLDWLQGQNLPPGWSRDDIQDALHWIQTTILNNGSR